jgi:hypothetical protein
MAVTTMNPTEYVIVGFLHSLCFESNSADQKITLDLSDATAGLKEGVLSTQQMRTKRIPNTGMCAVMDRMLFELNSV